MKETQRTSASALERGILYCGAAVAAFFATYALRSAAVAHEEPDLLAAAATFPTAFAARVPGTAYRAEGPLRGQLLAPPEFPAVREAIQVSAVMETREPGAAAWKAKTSGDGKERHFAANELMIGEAPFVLGGGTRVVAAVEERYLEQGELARVHLRWIPSEGKSFVAIGIWNGAALGDAPSATGILIEKGREAEAFDAVRKVAARRTAVNAAVGLLLAALAIGTVISARRTGGKLRPARGGLTPHDAGEALRTF